VHGYSIPSYLIITGISLTIINDDSYAMAMPDTNSLTRINEFRKLLKNYVPNIEVIDLLNQLKIVLLVAPAASGRNTIIKNLIMTGKYYYLTSDTTRKPRINNGMPERNGAEYWFRTENEILDSLYRGEYIEASVIHGQQVSGISIHELRKAVLQQRIAITDIDIQGSDYLKDYVNDAEHIFVLPPDYEEWMRRLDGRGAMDVSEKKRRLKSAQREIEAVLQRDYFKYVINWDLRSTTEQLHEEIISGTYDETRQSQAIEHAHSLLAKLKKVVN
jgi:guanylate kinase